MINEVREDALAREMRRLADLMHEAKDVQWDRSPVTGSTPVHGYNNPTLDTVMDPRRLAVRAAVTRAEDVLGRLRREYRVNRVPYDEARANLLATITELGNDLSRALDYWAGAL